MTSQLTSVRIVDKSTKRLANMEFKSVGKYISIISRQNHIYILNKLKPFGLGNADYPFLMHIPNEGSINQRQLCDELIIDPALASRSVKNLVDKGYIKKQKDQNDCRACNLSLTDKGRETKLQVRQVLKNASEKLSEDLSTEERDKLYDQLVKLANKAISINQEEKDKDNYK